MMKIGLIARGEDRGLGIQTWEFFRHMAPDRTLLIDMGPLAGPFTMHPERFPGATLVAFEDGCLPEQKVRDWLSGLDVVFTAETFYDDRFQQWCADARVATVNQVNPEFCHHIAVAGLTPPTQWWAPTPWHFDRLPGAKILMPVPVADDRFTFSPAGCHEPVRALHVVGHQAAGDRAGTTALMTALRYVRRPLHLTLASQGHVLPELRSGGRVTITHRTGGIGDYWALYDDFDVLIAPRRYGGLSLPTQEAMAAGLAVIMTDVEPNRYWPVLAVPATERGTMNTAIGQTPLMAAHPQALAEAIDSLDEHRMAMLQRDSVAWAQAHSWSVMVDQYRSAFEVAVQLARSS